MNTNKPELIRSYIRTGLKITGTAVIRKDGAEKEITMTPYELDQDLVNTQVMDRVSKELTELGFPHEVTSMGVNFLGNSAISSLTPKELEEKLNNIELDVLKDHIKAGVNIGGTGSEELLELINVNLVFYAVDEANQVWPLKNKTFESIDMEMPKNINAH